MIQVKKSITLMKPRAEVYQFWRQLERLPSFMIHLASVTEVSKTRSHWVAKAPGGTQVEWDADTLARILPRTAPPQDGTTFVSITKPRPSREASSFGSRPAVLDGARTEPSRGAALCACS